MVSSRWYTRGQGTQIGPHLASALAAVFSKRRRHAHSVWIYDRYHPPLRPQYSVGIHFVFALESARLEGLGARRLADSAILAFPPDKRLGRSAGLLGWLDRASRAVVAFVLANFDDVD